MPISDVSLLLDLSRSLVAVAVRSLGMIDGEVPLPQFRALVVLKRDGPCNAGELADGIGLHISTVTRLCDRLVAAGLIMRQLRPENRREVELTITPAGSELVERVWLARSTELSAALRSLSTAQRSCLRDAIPLLLGALGDASSPGGDDAFS